MAADLHQIEKMIQIALPGSRVEVLDPMGDGDHLQAMVVSELFKDKSRLEQHQMVYAALKEILKEQLHALALKTFTPEQWEKNK